MPRSKFILNLIPLTLFAGLIIFSFTGKQAMTNVYSMASYYIIFCLFLLWCVRLYKYLVECHFDPINFIRENWTGLCFALGITVVIFYTVPVHFKVLNDETNLLAVSQSMFYTKEPLRIFMGKYYNNSFHIIRSGIPNRPLLFPFAVHLVHLLCGYNTNNPFLLNFIFTVCFLSGTYIVARRYTDTLSSISAQLCVVSFPIFSICATSGGFELFSAFFFYLVMVLLFQFTKKPGASGFGLLWMTLLMLANIRYESIIFFFIIAGGLLIVNRRIYFKENAFIYAATPFFLLPYILQRILSQGVFQKPASGKFFSADHFFDNLGVMISHLMNLDFYLPYNGFLNMIGLGIAFFLLSQVLTKKITLNREQAISWVLFLFSLATMLVIILSFYLGRYDLPSQVRLFLYFCIAFSLVPVVLKILYPGVISGKMLMTTASVLFVLYHPIAEKNEFMNTLLTTRMLNQANLFLDELHDPNVLIISSVSGQFTVENYGAVTFAYANGSQKELSCEMQNKAYSQIITFQAIDCRTGYPVFQTEILDPAYKLIPLKEIQVMPNILFRVASVSL